MGEERFKKLYDALLECEELYVMFNGMTGDWEKDQKRFVKAQKSMEDSINFKDVDFE